jgi:hypothetical protein
MNKTDLNITFIVCILLCILQYIIYNIVTVNTTLYLHLKPSYFIHNMFRPIGPSSGDI